MKTLRKILALVIAIATMCSLIACENNRPRITTPAAQTNGHQDVVPTPSDNSLPTSPSDGDDESEGPAEPTLPPVGTDIPTAPTTPTEPDIVPPDDVDPDIPDIPNIPDDPDDPAIPGETDIPVVSDHTHTYVKNVTAATCTNPGYTTYTCECDNSYVSDEVPALGHTWSDWVVAEEATEKNEGTSKRRCNICGEAEYRSIPIVIPTHKHSYSGKVTNPTCMAGGYTTYTCTCGDVYIDNKTSAMGHKWGEWKTVKIPTDLAEGKAQRTCSICDKTENKPIDKLPHTHSYTKSVVRKESCGVTGITEYNCVCGSSYTEKSSALEHIYSDWVVVKEATPSNPGIEEMKCSICDKTYERPVYYEATNKDAAAIEAMVISLINGYRAQEGACELVAMPGCNEFSKIRSEQMAAKKQAAHNVSDARAAATLLKYGLYVDPSEYGLPGEPYYHVNASEAVGMNGGMSIDGVAEAMAEGFFESTSHWNLIGDKVNAFIGIGMTKGNDGLWYCCIIVAPVDLDTNPLGY